MSDQEYREQSYNSEIIWEGRLIRLSYTPRQWKVIDHLEIRADDGEPLPITKSGYRSHHFGPMEPVLTMSEVEEMLTAWLDKEAQTKRWKNYVEQSRQLSLF